MNPDETIRTFLLVREMLFWLSDVTLAPEQATQRKSFIVQAKCLFPSL